MNALPPLLFSNEALMLLIGFNAHHVRQGLTRRGDARRRVRPKRGPLSPQCLAQNICKLGLGQMNTLFNGTVRLIVATGLLRGDLTVALDGSKIVTPQSYEGRGCLSVTRTATEAKTQRRVTIVESVFGWKVLVLIDVRTRLPLAMRVGQIQEYEGQWLLPLVRQAQDNLGAAARITTVVIDRGYLDGEDLWALDQMGITFVVVARDDMVVAEDARSVARAGAGHVKERVETIRHGHGRAATTEHRCTRLVGVADLTTYDDYGDADHARCRHRKDFDGHPINAVVVLRWGARVYPTGGTVYLTNGPVADPFVAVDTYDWRSEIENGIFKEGKHPWHLEHFPQRTEAAVLVQCHFTLTVMALCTAFRLWQAAQHTAEAARTSILLGGEGTERWRRRLKEENRDKVIAFIGAHYGIFHVAELATLAGLRLKSIPPMLGTPQDILARYALGP